MELIPVHIQILSFLFLVAYLLSVGLETKLSEIADLLADRGLVARSLLANLVLVPALGLLLVGLFDLTPDTATGLMLLSIAPGGLFALNFARVAKGALVFAVALVFVMSLVAAIGTPLLTAIFVTRKTGSWVPSLEIVGILLLFLVVPLMLGRALQRRSERAAPKLARLLGVLSILLFVVVTVLTASIKSAAMKSVGAGALVAIVLLVVASWGIGWLLGGPAIETRKTLAITTSLRNVAVCLAVAVYYFPDTNVSVPIIAFSGLSVPMNAVFGIATKRMRRSTDVGAAT
jgi:bile acid:Na+ symporter, BASS family